MELMNFEQIENEFIKGAKITNTKFASDEFMTFDKETGNYIFEDGIICSPHEFWYYGKAPHRRIDFMLDGWRILEDAPST